ncbi:3-oxoadipate CoA-transferase subunit A domain protein [Acinetobacter sp. 883425]|nr:3-oxoadipate CoA-transferase subunit A domain protein [Acinetobacter sp. 883425]
MIDKSKSSLSEVLSQIKDGATILIGGLVPQDNPLNSLMVLLNSVLKA